MRQRFQVYLPRIGTRQRRRGQWVDAVEVFFPRYLFIHVDPLRHGTATIRSTRGAVGLVRFGTNPAVVSDEVIDALMQREDRASGLHSLECTEYYAGERIKLVDGPLAEMEGIFIQQDGEKRVIVMLELLGKANKIRVSRNLVARAA